MQRHVGFLIVKRDGRREWLRATKIARSVHAALLAAGETDEGRALDLAMGVVSALGAAPDGLDTVTVAERVRVTMVQRGHTLAALLYTEFGQRRRAVRGLSNGLSDRSWSEVRRLGDGSGAGGWSGDGQPFRDPHGNQHRN